MRCPLPRGVPGGRLRDPAAGVPPPPRAISTLNPRAPCADNRGGPGCPSRRRPITIRRGSFRLSAEPTPRAQPRSTFIATAPARAALVLLEQGLAHVHPSCCSRVMPARAAACWRAKPCAGAETASRRRCSPTRHRHPPNSPPRCSGCSAVSPSPVPPHSCSPSGCSRHSPTSPPAAAWRCTHRRRRAPVRRTSARTASHRRDRGQAPVPARTAARGSPALPARFVAPALAAVRARVSVRATLARFSPNDTREYLQMRLNAVGVPCTGMFSRKASRDIHQVSLGLVGSIEALAAEALRRAGRAGSGTVSPNTCAPPIMRCAPAGSATNTMRRRRARCVRPR